VSSQQRYLEHYGLAGEAEGDTLVVKEKGEAVLTARFDEQDRLAKLDVSIKPLASATP